MIRFVIFIFMFAAAAVYAIRRYGWSRAIRRRKLAASVVISAVGYACWCGGTKPPGTNDPPVITAPPSSNIVLRLYYRASDGHLYSIEALLKEVYRND